MNLSTSKWGNLVKRQKPKYFDHIVRIDGFKKFTMKGIVTEAETNTWALMRTMLIDGEKYSFENTNYCSWRLKERT